MISSNHAFTKKCFSLIIYQEGEIWPNSTIEISIIFKPSEEQNYSRTAYLDMTGRELRLPLKIKGIGVGPKAEFSFDTLDIENVFVNSKHSYEVNLTTFLPHKKSVLYRQ